MEYLAFLWDVVVHLDKHLAALLGQYGAWVYALFFLIIFCETGLVVTPFLPGVILQPLTLNRKIRIKQRSSITRQLILPGTIFLHL